jgi:hypothetical protein
MTGLDGEISDAVGLVGLLLVFVAGYLTATWSSAAELLERPVPEVAADRARLRGRVAATRAVATGSLVATIAVLVLLIPLSHRVVTSFDLRGRFDTLRAGLLLVDVFLLSLAISALVLVRRLTHRARELA